MAQKTKEEIKQLLTDLFSFNITEDYYKNEEKEKLVEDFKDILFFDDSVVRHFLANLFLEGKKLVKEFSLEVNQEQDLEDTENKPDEVEIPETNDEEEVSIPTEEEPKTKEEQPSPEPVPMKKESFDIDSYLSRSANQFLK